MLCSAFMARVTLIRGDGIGPEIMEAAVIVLEATGAKLDWVNCGLCVDERGAQEAIAGVRRGGPPDFAAFVEASDNTLVIPTRD